MEAVASLYRVLLRHLPRAAILFFCVACLRTPVTRRVCCDAAYWLRPPGAAICPHNPAPARRASADAWGAWWPPTVCVAPGRPSCTRTRALQKGRAYVSAVGGKDERRLTLQRCLCASMLALVYALSHPLRPATTGRHCTSLECARCGNAAVKMAGPWQRDRLSALLPMRRACLLPV